MGNMVRHITIGQTTYDLGDLRKEDFAGVVDPVASIKSVQETVIEILNILRGHQQDESTAS